MRSIITTELNDLIRLIEFADSIGVKFKASPHRTKHDEHQLYFFWLDDLNFEEREIMYKFAATIESTRFSDYSYSKLTSKTW